MAQSKKMARKPAQPKAKLQTAVKNKSNAVLTKGKSKPAAVLPTARKAMPAPKKLKTKAAVKSTSKKAHSVKKRLESSLKTAEPKRQLPVSPLPAIPHELIVRRATEIWAEKMRIANDSAQNWKEAEAELRAAQTT